MKQSSQVIPNLIKLHKASKYLELAYSDKTHFKLSCEYLRVMSPSAEVRGHGNTEPILQVGKKDVTLLNIEAVGNYALKLCFDDGHDSGLYTWDYLHELGHNYDAYWQDYLLRLKAAKQSRESMFITIKPVE